MADDHGGGLVRPTPEQVQWADCEVGVLIHLDIQVFEPGYEFREQWGYQPAPAVFKPTELATDQWLETAKAAGARYAVLVAKHCSGFCLWPTDAYEYSMKSSPWRDGQGDIVGDFIASCEEYGLRPGLYYSTVCNAWCDVDNPGKVRSGDPEEQRRYKELVEQQLTEIWTRYGKLFEIWFDGGTLPVEAGGADVPGLLNKYQPQAVCFQGPPGTRSPVRWVGNEQGEAPYPCWSTVFSGTGEDGATEPTNPGGDPNGTLWAPAESDMPNRNHRWFWRQDEDHLLYPAAELLGKYCRTVGRNSNLLLGLVPDNRGLIPDADVRQFAEFGQGVASLFSNCLGKTSGSGESVELQLSRPGLVNQVVIMEDIAQGERLRKYRVEGLTGGDWQELCRGLAVGHKRIEQFAPVEVSRIRLICEEAAATPVIRSLTADDNPAPPPPMVSGVGTQP